MKSFKRSLKIGFWLSLIQSSTLLLLFYFCLIQKKNLIFPGGHQVVVEKFKEAMEPLTLPYKSGELVFKKSLSYKDSGVDIEAGDSLVSMIKPLAR